MPFFEDNSISHNIETDESFRAWGKKISDGLAAVGLVKTEDTGQIDWETVETPSENGTYAGYEIWRFDDALQATQPIYIKLEYGRSSAASRPAMATTYGRGSDGSGTLTNPSARKTLEPEKTPSGNGYIYISFFEGAFSLLSCAHVTETNTNTINAGTIFTACERLKDPFLNPIDAFCIPRNRNNFSETRTWDIYNEGTWNETVGTSVGFPIPASTAFGGLISPALFIFTVPRPTAPLTVVSGFLTGEVAANDTGLLKLNDKEIQYKAMPIEYPMRVSNIDHRPLLINEE